MPAPSDHETPHLSNLPTAGAEPRSTTLQRLVFWLRRQQRPEVELLAGVLVTATLLLGFLALADEVTGTETVELDHKILLALRSADGTRPIGPWWLGEAAEQLTALGGWPIATTVVLVAMGLLAIQRRWQPLVLVFVSMIGGMTTMVVLKLWFARPRPDVVPHLVDVITHSFPSGHAMLSAVVYTTLGALTTQLSTRRGVKLYLLSVSILIPLVVGVTRVLLGVHYPTDVAAGWALGFAWALMCLLFARWLVLRGRLRTEPAS